MPREDYPSCRRTYATLRVYHKTASPSVVTRVLKIRPTDTQTAGKPWRRRGREEIYPISGWFLDSEASVESDDSALHLRWLVAALKEKAPSLVTLKGRGWWMDIAVYWDSDAGHGGPTLDPALLAQLGALGIEVWFDIYFSGAMDYTRMVKRACATSAKET